LVTSLRSPPTEPEFCPLRLSQIKWLVRSMQPDATNRRVRASHAPSERGPPTDEGEAPGTREFRSESVAESWSRVSRETKGPATHMDGRSSEQRTEKRISEQAIILSARSHQRHDPLEVVKGRELHRDLALRTSEIDLHTGLEAVRKAVSDLCQTR